MNAIAAAKQTSRWDRLVTLKVSRPELIVWLELATLIYAGLPVVIWLFGWLKLGFSAILGTGLIVAIGLAWTQTRSHFRLARVTDTEPPYLPVWPLIGAALLAILWGVYSGAGGFTFSNADWLKHFAVLRDLMELKWPVAYSVGENTNPLVYYLAYYIPAAAIGSKFGWEAACLTLLVWTCLGTVIACGWFAILAGSRPFLAGVYFILANGLDFIGERLVSGEAFPSGVAHTDWWAGWTFLNFPGHYSQLVWAPQHSLVTWAVTGLLAVQLSARRNLGHAGLLAALVAFWSPFAVIGLVPLALYALIKEKARGLISIPNGVGVLLLAVDAAFMLSQTTSFPHGPVMHNASEEWSRFLLFHALEWGIFALFANELRRSLNPRLRGIFWTALAGLAVIPLFRLGYFNDWCMRASIPSLFLLWAGVARSVLRTPYGSETRILLILCFFGAMGALRESARSWNTLVSKPPAMESFERVPHLEGDFARQYLGNNETFFFRHLARPLHPFPIAAPPHEKE